MLRALTNYHRPDNLREALQLLAHPHTLPLAGGTDLLGRGDTLTQTVIDLQDLGLDYIHSEGDGLHIGAMTRLQALIDHPATAAVAGGLLARSILGSLVNTERNAATLGGALASAPAWSDLPAALLAVDAAVEMQTAETRSLIPAVELLASRDVLLGHGALITDISVPVQPRGARYAAERVSRTPADRAIVCVAVRLAQRDGMLRDVRVAAAGVARTAVRLTTAEAVLEGAPLPMLPVELAARAAMSAAAPADDHLATSDYRRAMLGVLLTRAVNDAASALGGGDHA
jgi:CO/xanthine dehydrogenase FAD-binding subunit